MSFLSLVLNDLLLKLIFVSDYEPTILKGFLSRIQRYLNKQNYDFTIFTDAEFKTPMATLKSKQMDLKAKGVGNKPMIFDGLTDEDIEKLHASKCPGINLKRPGVISLHFVAKCDHTFQLLRLQRTERVTLGLDMSNSNKRLTEKSFRMIVREVDLN